MTVYRTETLVSTSSGLRLLVTTMMIDRNKEQQLSWMLIVTAVLGWRLVNTAAVQVLVITC